jgi:hypothetical protein
MSEKVVRAKRYAQLWFLGAHGRGFDIVDIVAWIIPDSGPAIPVTPFGRFDVSKPYVVGSGVSYIAFPGGRVLSDSNAVDYYLRYGDAL